MNTYGERRARQRRFLRRNFLWLVPLGILAGVGLFFGLGNLVVWLWRMTVVDIFAVKPISFWQAWGLMLLSQILFKANMYRSTGSMYRRHYGPDAATGPGRPEQEI